MIHLNILSLSGAAIVSFVSLTGRLSELFSVSYAFFWTTLAGVMMIGSVGLFMRRFKVRRQRKEARKEALSEDEELRLWAELGKIHTAQAPAIGSVPGREGRLEVRLPEQEAASITDLFQTLREDQLPSSLGAEVPTGVAAGTEGEPVAGRPRREPGTLKGEPSMDRLPESGPAMIPEAPTPVLGEQRAPWTPPTPAIGTLQPWLRPGVGEHPGFGDRTPGSVEPWPEQLEELPFRIRMDITDRLDADLEAIRPGVETSAETRALFKRRKSEHQKRDFERFNRQVSLAKALIHLPRPDLRKRGIELADRLEKELHARKRNHVRRTYGPSRM